MTSCGLSGDRNYADTRRDMQHRLTLQGRTRTRGRGSAGGKDACHTFALLYAPWRRVPQVAWCLRVSCWPMWERREGGETRAMARGWCATATGGLYLASKSHGVMWDVPPSLLATVGLGDRLTQRLGMRHAVHPASVASTAAPPASSHGRHPPRFLHLFRGQSAKTALQARFLRFASQPFLCDDYPMAKEHGPQRCVADTAPVPTTTGSGL